MATPTPNLICPLSQADHARAAVSDGPMWLVQYFAPWCHQCITNKMYFVLVARKLRQMGVNVRVGAVPLCLIAADCR